MTDTQTRLPKEIEEAIAAFEEAAYSLGYSDAVEFEDDSIEQQECNEARSALRDIISAALAKAEGK